MTESDLYMCRYATAGEDIDGITIPWCTLSGLSCEDVLRYGDEGCKYEREKSDLRDSIVDRGYIYHPIGKKGVRE